MEDYCDSPSVMHTEQQTDINGAIIDKVLEENEILKAELRSKTMNIDLIVAKMMSFSFSKCLLCATVPKFL